MNFSLNIFFASIASLYFAFGTYLYLLYKLDLNEEWPQHYVILISVYFFLFIVLFITHYILEYKNGNFTKAMNSPKVIKVKRVEGQKGKGSFILKIIWGLILGMIFMLAEIKEFQYSYDLLNP